MTAILAGSKDAVFLCPESPGTQAGGMTYRPPGTPRYVPAPEPEVVPEPEIATKSDDDAGPRPTCPVVKKNGFPCSGFATSTGYCIGHSNQLAAADLPPALEAPGE